MMAALRSYDERILDVIVARRRRWLDIFMRCVTHVGDWPSMVGITAALSLGFPTSELRRVGLKCLVVLTASHLLVQLMKRTINRARPKLPPGAFVMEPPDRFSFPSGHATAGLAVAFPLYFVLPPLAALVVLGLGLSIGVSRAYLGVHYPGDVLMGWVTAVTTSLVFDWTFPV